MHPFIFLIFLNQLINKISIFYEFFRSCKRKYNEEHYFYALNTKSSKCMKKMNSSLQNPKKLRMNSLNS